MPSGERRRRSLHDEDVELADVLLDLDLEVLVGKAGRVRATERNAEAVADLVWRARDANAHAKTLSPLMYVPPSSKARRIHPTARFSREHEPS